MSKTIMDVSRWQGNINWDKVKAIGKIDGVMLRAMGNSKTGVPSKPYLDPTFERNYAECTLHSCAQRSGQDTACWVRLSCCCPLPAASHRQFFRWP